MEGGNRPGLHARASAVKVRDQFVMARFGRTSRDRYRSAASPELRGAFETPGDRWVDFALFVEATELACTMFADGDIELAADIGMFAAEANMGPWRAAVHRILSPGFVLGLAGQLWSHHYDGGRIAVLDLPQAQRLTALDVHAGGVRLRIEDFPLPARAHCHSIRGWCLGTIRLGRPKTASVVESSCRLRGDSACEFLGQWSR